MKTIRQFRFYNDGNEHNYGLGIENLTKQMLVDGSIFNGDDQKGYIRSIGIQTLPGTKFYMPGNNAYPIIVGTTGIFELDLTKEVLNDSVAIYGIKFDAKSLDVIESAETGYLIIDLIYDTEVNG